MGNKTGPIDYIEHPVTLFGGEFIKEDYGIKREGRRVTSYNKFLVNNPLKIVP